MNKMFLLFCFTPEQSSTEVVFMYSEIFNLPLIYDPKKKNKKKDMWRLTNSNFIYPLHQK